MLKIVFNLTLLSWISYNVVLPAYKLTELMTSFMVSDKSFIKIKNRRGSKLDPCGMPYLPYHIQINSHLYGLAGTCYTDVNKTMINSIHLVCNVVAFDGVK